MTRGSPSLHIQYTRPGLRSSQSVAQMYTDAYPRRLGHAAARNPVPCQAGLNARGPLLHLEMPLRGLSGSGASQPFKTGVLCPFSCPVTRLFSTQVRVPPLHVAVQQRYQRGRTAECLPAECRNCLGSKKRKPFNVEHFAAVLKVECPAILRVS